MSGRTTKPKSGDRVVVNAVYGDHSMSIKGNVVDVLSRQFTIQVGESLVYVMLDDDWSFDAEETA